MELDNCFAVEVVNRLHFRGHTTTRRPIILILHLVFIVFAICNVHFDHPFYDLLSMITRSIYVKSAEISTITKTVYTDTRDKKKTKYERGKKLKWGDKKRCNEFKAKSYWNMTNSTIHKYLTNFFFRKKTTARERCREQKKLLKCKHMIVVGHMIFLTLCLLRWS